MYALFSETLDGAVTIRAFDQQVRLCYPYMQGMPIYVSPGTYGFLFVLPAWNLLFSVCSCTLSVSSCLLGRMSY